MMRVHCLRLRIPADRKISYAFNEMLTSLRSALPIVFLVQILAWGQAAPVPPQATGPNNTDPKKRDLKLRPDTDVLPPAASLPATVPKGYALVIGIGRYQNLPEASSLRYSESDAEAMYRVLISPESGESPARRTYTC